MSNAEERGMFSDELEKEAEKARKLAIEEKKQADIKFARECKCFKDLIVGREREFEECKEYLIHYIYRLIQANGQLDTNFLAGMRLVIEIFEELPGKYDTTVANLGKE